MVLYKIKVLIGIVLLGMVIYLFIKMLNENDLKNNYKKL
jgi:hypothetical protein